MLLGLTFTLSGERNPIPCEPYGLTRYQRCLQGSAKTKIFSDYFLFTEKSIKFYNQYQIKVKNIKIDNLENNLKEMLIELKKSNNKLDISNSKLDQLLIENKEIKELLHASSHDRVTDVEEKFTETFILMKDNEENNKFYSIRAQKEYIEKKIISMRNNYTIILKYPCCPNTMMLNNKVKKELKKMGWADIKYNDFILNDDFTEQDLINIFNEVYNERIIKL